MKEFKKAKGTWYRFWVLIKKSNLPWIYMVVYTILSLGLVNIGISETEYTAQLFDGNVSSKLVTQLVIVMLINWFGATLEMVVRSVTSARIDRNVRKSVWRKILSLPMEYFGSESPRDTISRITTDASSVSPFFIMAFIPFIVQIYSTVMILMTLSSYDTRLTLTTIVIIPIIIIVTNVLGKLLFKSNNNIAKVRSQLTARLSEMIASIPIIRLFAQEDKEQAKGDDISAKLYQVEIKVSWVSLLGNLVLDVVFLIQMISILLIGRALINDGEITSRAWVVFFLFSGKVSNNIQDLIMIWKNIKLIQGSTAKISEIMDAESEDDWSGKEANLSGDIRFNNVSFWYHEDYKLLDHINCSFPAGKVTALVGVSGRGKTTMFNLLTQLYKTKSGEITIGDIPVTEYGLSSYRRQFFVLTQQPVLFSGTVVENLVYGLNYYPTFEQMTTALKEAQADFVFDFAEGLDTQLGEYGETLSGGQRQRLVIARALLSNAPYWLLDEAFSALDRQATADIMEIIKKAAKNRTVIIIAHDPSILQIADYVVVLDKDGVMEGTTDDLLKKNQFFQDFYQYREVSVGE